MGLIASADLKRIIHETDDLDAARLLVSQANAAGKRLADDELSTSQIRALFGEVRQIQSQMSGLDLEYSSEDRFQKALNRLTLLKPKMAYRIAKDKNKDKKGAIKSLVEILDPAVDLVVEKADRATQKQRFARFVDLFEAILAYHRFHGGS